MIFGLNDKVEEALGILIGQAVAAVAGQDVGVFTGKDDRDKTQPCVIIGSTGDGEEDPKGSGNFWVNLKVQIEHLAAPVLSDPNSTPDDPKVDIEAIGDAVFGVIMDSQLPANMSKAIPNFTVFNQGIIYGAPETDRNDDIWIDAITLRVYCCASALP